jgi:PAS domain S-box-containing protein
VELPTSEEAEAARARFVAVHDVVGVRESGALNDITDFAAALCEAPVALVTLITDQDQHFMGRTGTTMLGTPRNISFCEHALGSSAITEIPDAAADPRFVANPLVTEDPKVRFYAGAPLIGSDGVALGTLCVLDVVPRLGLTPLQRQGLEVLARAALQRLDETRLVREQATSDALSRAAVEDSENRFRTLADTMPQMVWSTLPDGYHDYYNARWYAFTGVPEGSTDGEGWNDMFHPDDQERAWARWRHSLETGEQYDIEYRLKHHDGTYRWVLGRALPIRDAGGAITRWFGTCTDIHEQKLALEEREVISQELSHRIKNIFAVIAGLITVAARAHPALRPLVEDLRQRITALGRAHDFVRPHSAASRRQDRPDSLHGLLADLFAPYGKGRIVVSGDDLAVDDRSTTPLALLFHELATNATKHGALSAEGGQVTLEVEAGDERSLLRWSERGGPAPDGPGPAGFGSQLVELSVVRQLGGTVRRDWTPKGLVVTVEVPTAALSRSGRRPA